MSVQTSDPRLDDVRDNSFALAIAVLRERICRLSKADQDDLYQLIPDILCGDDEARQSAQRAVNEILDGAQATIRSMRMDQEIPSELSGWTNYVAWKLKEARTEAGLTQQQLSEKSGIPQSHISRLEAGQHSANAKTIEKLAAALKKSASYFDPSA